MYYCHDRRHKSCHDTIIETLDLTKADLPPILDSTCVTVFASKPERFRRGKRTGHGNRERYRNGCRCAQTSPKFSCLYIEFLRPGCCQSKPGLQRMLTKICTGPNSSWSAERRAKRSRSGTFPAFVPTAIGIILTGACPVKDTDMAGGDHVAGLLSGGTSRTMVYKG